MHGIERVRRDAGAAGSVVIRIPAMSEPLRCEPHRVLGGAEVLGLRPHHGDRPAATVVIRVEVGVVLQPFSNGKTSR